MALPSNFWNYRRNGELGDVVAPMGPALLIPYQRDNETSFMWSRTMMWPGKAYLRQSRQTKTQAFNQRNSERHRNIGVSGKCGRHSSTVKKMGDRMLLQNSEMVENDSKSSEFRSQWKRLSPILKRLTQIFLPCKVLRASGLLGGN